MDNVIDVAFLLQKEQEKGQRTLGMTREAAPPPPLFAKERDRG